MKNTMMRNYIYILFFMIGAVYASAQNPPKITTTQIQNLIVDSTRINTTGDTAYYYQNGVLIGTGPIAGGGGGTTYNNITETADTLYITDYLDVDTSTLYVDATNNRVGIGTNSPIGPLDISSGNLSGAIILGGDEDAFTRTNNENKWARMVAPHYDNSEENVMLFSAATLSNNNDILIGGGASATNSATRILFITAANTTTTSGTLRLAIISNGNVGIGTSTPSYLLEVNGTAAKPGGGTWANSSSDRRLKKNIRSYTNGLSKLLEINPVYYEYNGLGGLPTDKEYVGIIAQEILPILPETITYNKIKLNEDDDGETQVYGFDGSNIQWIMVNSIKEQQAIIETQQQEIEQLKTQIQLILTEIEQIKNK